MQVQDMDMVTDYVQADEVHPGAQYAGNAAFDIANRKLYATDTPGRLPFLRFHSAV